MKVLIWAQHLLGMGHIMRAAALARALAEKGVETLLISGGPVSNLVDAGKAELLTLPACRAADVSFKRLLDENNDPVTENWWAARGAQLAAYVEAFDPDGIVTETFPFGRKPFGAELLPVLHRRRALARPTVIIASVRDILVGKRAEKQRVMADIAKADFDHVLVHGDPAFARFEESFHFADEIAGKIAYTGYILSAPSAHAPRGEGAGEIIVSCGSGAIGAALLRAVKDGRRRSKSAGDATWRVLAGYGIAEGLLDGLRATGDGRLIVERARPDFASMLRRARLSINQGGYNTVMDVIASGVRSLTVPISASGETEQEHRATLLAKRGLLVCLPERALTPDTLAEAADRALALEPEPHGLDLDGAKTSAEMIIERIRAGR